jgi:endo-1,4-beta-xylanase
MSRTPSLTARISAKSGPYPARVWTITLQNSGPGQARAAQITGLTLTRTAGPACTPVITSPAAFPLTVGTITPNGSASANVTINFTGCGDASRFTVNIPFNSNSGTYSGSTRLTNQTR